jgi:hypothetical protein
VRREIEMKKMLFGSLIGAGMVILIASFVIPASAHGPGAGETAPASRNAWEAMYEACIGGDREAMAEAMEAIHERYSAGMPCFNYSFDGPEEGTQAPETGWRGSGGHMGGGRMGGHIGGPGGMMGR